MEKDSKATPSYWFHQGETRVSKITAIKTVYRQHDGGMSVFIEVEDLEGGYTVTPEWLAVYKPKVDGYILARSGETVTYLDEATLFDRYSEVVQDLEEMTGALCGHVVKFRAGRVVGCNYEYGPHHRPTQANLTVNQGLVSDNSNCTTLLLCEEDLGNISLVNGETPASLNAITATKSKITGFGDIRLDYILLQNLQLPEQWLALSEAQWRRQRNEPGAKAFIEMLAHWNYVQPV